MLDFKRWDGKYSGRERNMGLILDTAPRLKKFKFQKLLECGMYKPHIFKTPKDLTVPSVIPLLQQRPALQSGTPQHIGKTKCCSGPAVNSGSPNWEANEDSWILCSRF